MLSEQTIAFDPNNLVLKKTQTKQLYVWAPAIIEPKKEHEQQWLLSKLKKMYDDFCKRHATSAENALSAIQSASIN